MAMHWNSIAISLASGMVDKMKTAITVDEVGRMVLPKSIREAIGLTGRSTVSVEVVGQTVHIVAPERPAGPVSHKKGRVVYAGQLPKGWDSGEAVMEMREKGLRR
jgi:AbrB family looped-hinge helix DNA binding protein